MSSSSAATRPDHGATRLDRLDLNLLVALDVLLAERSMTVAANRLHLSPSAASSVLGRLRDYFAVG